MESKYYRELDVVHGRTHYLKTGGVLGDNAVHVNTTDTLINTLSANEMHSLQKRGNLVSIDEIEFDEAVKPVLIKLTGALGIDLIALKMKAGKWDKLRAEVDEFYSKSDKEQEEEMGLIALGEIVATACGYL